MPALFIDPTRLQRTAGTSSKKRIEQTAQQFEAILLKEVVKHAVPKLEGGQGSDTYSDMMAHELAGMIASSGAIGLAKMITKNVPEAGATEPSPKAPAPALIQSSGHSHDAVEHRISSAYGARMHPVTGRHSFHHGVDVAVPTGTPLAAPMPGTVARVSDGGHGGLSVTLSHGVGQTTTYRHLDSALVSEGDTIEAGQTFATSGATGRVTGPHLHLEATRGGRGIDPAPLVNQVLGKNYRPETKEAE